MAANDEDSSDSVRLRIRREAGGLWSWVRALPAAAKARWDETRLREWYGENWASSRRFRIFNYVIGAFLTLNLLVYVTVTTTCHRPKAC